MTTKHIAESPFPTPGVHAPAWTEFRLTDAGEVEAILDELRAVEPAPEWTEWGRDAHEQTIRAAERALAILTDPSDTRDVFVAEDEDGYWFALTGRDQPENLNVYRDAEGVTAERRGVNDDDAPPFGWFPTADYDCDVCERDSTLLVDMDVELRESGADPVLVQHVAGEWRVRCAFCGTIYIVPDA